MHRGEGLMPDLMTHLTSSYLLKRLLAGKRNIVPFLLGATLPDMIAYIPLVASGLLPLEYLPVWTNALTYLFFPFHGIVGFTLLSWMLALLFQTELRKGIFWNLELGGLVHVLMDLLQSQHGQSGYLLFPFSGKSFGLGWLETESSLYAVPFLVAAVVIMLGIDSFRQRKTSP